MSDPVFQFLDIAGLRPGTAADAFIDLPAATPGRWSAAPRLPASADPLDALHQEFQRVLADPGQLAGRADWLCEPVPLPWPAADAAIAGADARTVPPPPSIPRVFDCLLPTESLDGFIARFLASLDPAEPATLLDENRPPEVLQLFAPTPTPAATGGGYRSLPVTTRRDHHALSPDSAVDIGRFAAPAEESRS